MDNSLRRVPALLLLLLLCGCGRGGETTEIRYYRLASGQSANHLANQACERFCSLVEKESGGAIQIIPSFENELGTDASALEQCVYGGIDFVRTPLSAAAAYAPQLSALQLPYEYTSDEHLFRVLDGDVGADAMDSLEEQGLTGLSYFYAGYRCFFTTDKPITGLDDMQGLRLGTEDSSQMQQIIPQWGAVAVTLPPDEFALALRTHRIDGAESTLPTYVDSGYYRLAPYWTYDRHSYNGVLGDMGGVLARGAAAAPAVCGRGGLVAARSLAGCGGQGDAACLAQRLLHGSAQRRADRAVPRCGAAAL